ncbi:PREDICTED: uncharacterized protein LOC105561190 [Vollenhovia emeryi]|uniref:uncharacterized protein LOC105561190 n=1 Tax=Vollenhovia emeryi TaxID=411798 RepID=UPI0005F4A3D9|nr:PREDICTED: uncharacterized protein LOC105561190 [Vollenhovia emeryi]
MTSGWRCVASHDDELRLALRRLARREALTVVTSPRTTMTSGWRCVASHDDELRLALRRLARREALIVVTSPRTTMTSGWRCFASILTTSLTMPTTDLPCRPPVSSF